MLNHVEKKVDHPLLVLCQAMIMEVTSCHRKCNHLATRNSHGLPEKQNANLLWHES